MRLPKPNTALVFLLLFIHFLFLVPAYASDRQSPITGAQPIARERVASRVRWLTDRIDDLFGAERDDENRPTSTLRINAMQTLMDGGPNSSAFSARLTLRPSAFENWTTKLKDWVDVRGEKIRTRLKRTESVNPDVSYDQTFDQAQQQEDENPFRFSIEERVRISGSNRFQISAKVTKDIEDNWFLHHFSGALQWSEKMRWENHWSILSSLSLSKDWLLKLNNILMWEITREELGSVHGPSLIWRISDSQGLSLGGVLTKSFQSHSWQTESYGLTSTYRQELYTDWIALSFDVFRIHNRDKNFLPDNGFTISCEAKF